MMMRHGSLKVLIGLLVVVVWVVPAEAKFRALLVGINYQGADLDLPRLNGAINDVRDMSALMTETFGIPRDSIRLLIEEQATRAAILQNFREWLIEGTVEGDVIFFQYAGHGASVPDPTGSQKQDPLKQQDAQSQALAEAFVPYDAKVDAAWQTVANLILDSEFHLLLNALKGRKVVLFLDCCHSGGITRDFASVKTVARYVQFPWDPRETRVLMPPDFPEHFPADVLRGLKIERQHEASWHPEYAYFAAVKYAQLAYDLHEHGAFTLPVLRLLQTNPMTNYTNRQILEYARKYIHQALNIPEIYQEPVFYGPEDALDEPFVLLTQRSSAIGTSPPSGLVPQPMQAIGKTAVWLTGQEGDLKSQIFAAIENRAYLQPNATQPDVIVEVGSAGVNLHNAFGKHMQTIAIDADVVSNVMNALEGLHLIRQLARLENPAAPFAVELWLDEPGKTTFTTSDRVTLYYRVNGLPKGAKAYLTLLNVAQDGTVAMLYPQKQDVLPGIGTKLYLNAEVETGKVYSIPKTQQALKPEQNVAVDLRLRLEAGQEYFKALVTSEPVDWERLNLGEFHNRFEGQAARGLVITVADAVQQITTPFSWAAGTLRVEVKENDKD